MMRMKVGRFDNAIGAIDQDQIGQRRMLNIRLILDMDIQVFVERPSR
jgi:hypothetical protein